MAITNTELKVHLGTTSSGTQVGNTIQKNGSPATINLNSTELGVALSPGTQYCATARCLNSDSVWSSWTEPRLFKTKIFAEILSACAGGGSVNPVLQFTYNNNDTSVYSCGIYASTNASGTNAQKITASDEQEATDGNWSIDNLPENTQFYIVAWVRDENNADREFVGDWLTEAEQINTGFHAPTVTISNITTTTNSISGNLNVSTNDTVREVYINIRNSGGGTVYKFSKTAQTGVQNFTISNGDVDDNNQTISIQPSTEYQIIVYAANSTSVSCGGTTTYPTGNSGWNTATTQQAVPTTILITGISSITPTSAVASLSYGDGQQSQQPAQ